MIKFGSRLCQALEEFWIALFAWIPTPIGVVIRLFAWRWFFASCGKVRFDRDLTIGGLGNIRLGNGCRIGKGVFLTAANGQLVLADEVAVSPNANIGADDGEIFIGRNVAIGPGTVIRSANHCFARADVPIMFQGHRRGLVEIEEDVWIGANCVITPDVRIGRGAVVGAGAVVTRNVEPFSIVGGVPARIIGNREQEGRACP